MAQWVKYLNAIFTNKLFLLRVRVKFPILKIMLNRTITYYEFFFLCKFYSKMFGGFWETDRFLIVFLDICLKMFTHPFRSLAKYISYLIFNGLVMVKNKKTRLFAITSNKNTRSILALISHTSFISEFLKYVKYC